MSHDPQVMTELQQSRAAWAVARAATVQTMQDAAAAEQAWAALAATLPATDAGVIAARAASDNATAALASARNAERQARLAVTNNLTAWLDADPGADVRTMSGSYPIALFPCRLETRFDPPLAPATLKVRIYPDDIQSDSHEPELTASEGQAGDTFWSTSAGGLDKAEAWRRLLLSFPAERAAYIVQATDPAGTRPAQRPSSWTRPAESRLLPDRWLVVAYRNGREIYRALTKPVVEPLALSISPLMGVSGDASAIGNDPDLGWAADFNQALTVGMAATLPLTAYDAQVGFDRLVVIGVKATLAPTDAAAQLGDLWRDHSYSRGVAFVPQGSPTNNTSNAPAAYPPDDPNGASSFARLFPTQAPAADVDGALFMNALGLPATLAAPIAGAWRQEQTAARTMNLMLWTPTWGYFLRELMASGFDPLPGGGNNPFSAALIASARSHFMAYVRGRGPYPAFRIGTTPYGLLPATTLRHWTGFGSAPAAAPDLITMNVFSAAGQTPGRDEIRIGRSIHSPARGLYMVAETTTPIPSGSNLFSFAIAQWAGDGEPDLYILRRTGTASGHTEFTVLSASSGYREIIVQGATALGLTASGYAFTLADWDNDGKPDLFQVIQQGASATEVTVLSGASGFQTTLLHAVTALPKTDANWAFAIADWDKDGKPDLIAVQINGAASQHVEVHVLSGASQFAAEILHADTGVASMANADVSVSDWDGDGIVDLILAQRGQPGLNNLMVTIVQGSSQFKTALPVLAAGLTDADPPVGLHILNLTPAAVIGADWDGDGRAELLAVRNDGTPGTGGIGVTVFSTAPVIKFVDSVRFPDPNRGSRRTAAATVLDGSGNSSVDLVLLQATAQTSSTDLSYRIARGLGPDGVPSSFMPDDSIAAGPAIASGLVGAGVGAADLDGDGVKELVVFHLDSSAGTSRGAYRVGWKLDPSGNVDHWSTDVTIAGTAPPTTGTGRPVGPVRLLTQYIGGSLALADINGSGKPDMIVLLADQLTVLTHQASLYYVVGRDLDASGQVTGGWTNTVSVPFSLSPGYTLGVGGVAVGDVDQDGTLDIVVCYSELAASGNIGWYRIGWKLDPTGVPQAGWSDPYRIPGTSSASIAGAVLAHLSQGGWSGLLHALADRQNRGSMLVPRINTDVDPEADLLKALALHPSARQVAIRRGLGPDALVNLYTYLGSQAFFQPINSDWATWYQRILRRARSLFQGIGGPAWNAATNTAQWNPRIADVVFDGAPALFNQPLVAPAPLSETAQIPALNNVANYLQWLPQLPPVHIHPSDTALDNATGGDQHWPLLFYLARHGLLEEYASAAYQIDVAQNASPATADQDPELVGVIPGAAVRTVWDRLLSNMPSAPNAATTVPVWQYLFNSGPTYSMALKEYRSAMLALAKLPTAELDRLASETLDVCSHRVDSWVTSMATRRLQTEIRPAAAKGLYVGAFGWLESVVPAAQSQYTGQMVGGQPVLLPRFGGGYIHAPSPAMASAAAVLRNAYMSRGGPGSSTYAIDLSSERARVGRDVLDSIRQGVPLGAVLGYRVERILDDAGLQRYIDPLRRLYPLVPLAEPAPGAAAGSTAGRTVMDGLALRAAWPSLPWGQGDLPNVTADQQQLHALLDGELGVATQAASSWLDPLDAVGDLMMAEAVYQTVRGNKTGAVASLDALSQGTRPPDPEILREPRHGIGVTHRVGVVLGDPAAALTGWPTATPRASADPYLDAWAGSLLGDPAQVRCRASVSTGKPVTITSLGEISLANLGLHPLDVLQLARTSSQSSGASEIDQRVASAALKLPGAPRGSSEDNLSITYDRDPQWPLTVRSFPEILELARSINALLGRSRPLQPVDLLSPDSIALASQAASDTANATARAQTASAGFDSCIKALQDVVRATTPAASAIRSALLALSSYNLPAGIPKPALGTGADAVQALLKQAQSVLTTALKRQTTAHTAIAAMASGSGGTAEEAARAAVQAIFGGDLPFLVGFTPVEAQPGQLAQALSAQSELLATSTAPADETLRRWLLGAARVRPSLDLWRRMSLYASALGNTAIPWSLAQLPYRSGEAWIGLPFTTQPPRAGLVSLVLNRFASPAPGTVWAGLLIDEWSEVIPSPTVNTGVGFHYRSPSSQAPQTVLLAVCPYLGGTWDIEVLLSIVGETLDLAHARTVDASLIGSLGQFLPATLLACNASGDTVSTDFRYVQSAD